jgi:hypothetical protein
MQEKAETKVEEKTRTQVKIKEEFLILSKPSL